MVLIDVGLASQTASPAPRFGATDDTEPIHIPIAEYFTIHHNVLDFDLQGTSCNYKHATTSMAVSNISPFQQPPFTSSTLEFVSTPAVNGDMDMDMDVDLGADEEISALEA